MLLSYDLQKMDQKAQLQADRQTTYKETFFIKSLFINFIQFITKH